MEAVIQKITLYHNLFQGCLILALICLVIAVVLFFLLDIKEVIGYLSGRQRRKKVKEMEAGSRVEAASAVSEDGSTEILGRPEARKGMFRIERELCLIHTDEVV